VRGLERVVTEMSWSRSAIGARRASRLRAWAATTPGRLRLAMAVVLLAAVVAGLVLAGVTAVQRDATDSIATRDEPLMVDADGLYASLSDADATAATMFLRGGTEPADLRARYLADLRRASVQLAGLGRRVQGASEAAAVAATAAELPVYSGLIETARANNRQGFPVGAAYLREASDLMRARILPAAGRLYAAEAQRLGDNQRTDTSTGGLVAVLIACVAALIVIVGAQVFLARRTHRVFNVPLVVATVVLAGLATWIMIALTSAQDSIARAQRDGSDAVQVLSAARILWLRAQADESLALVARGGGDRYAADFVVVDRLLEPPRGLLGEASRLAARTGSTARVDDLTATWREVLAEHARVARLESDGRFGEAVSLAVGARAREAALGDRLNRRFGELITAAQRRFDDAAGNARSALRGVAVGIPVLLVVCTLLALLGLQTRLNEYR
jgi:hypothetical protein